MRSNCSSKMTPTNLHQQCSPLSRYLLRAMGTKAQQKSPSKIALTKEKKPTTTLEHSSAQIIKQPRHKKKKRTRRRKSKSQNPQLTVLGQSCSIHGYVSKGLPPEMQESTTNTLLLQCEPSKKDNLGESHNAKLETENKNTFGKEKVEHSEKPKDTSSSKNQRLKYPTVVEKKKYQAVSEYQFIYPGKPIFLSSQENTKQHLRSIYQVKADPKPPRPTPLSVRMPHCQWELRKSQRGNVIADANCPIGSDFLRGTHPRNPAQGLTNLTHKINKLVLVKEKDQAAPAENVPPIHAGDPYFPQLQHYSISEKAGPLTKAFQRSRHATAKKEVWGEPQEPKVPWGRFSGLPAHSQNAPKLRPVSAKEYYEKALDQMFGRERGPAKEYAEEEWAAPNTLGADAESKGAIAQTKSAIVIPTVSQYLSSENLSTKGIPLRWKTATQFLAEKKVPERVSMYSSQGETGPGSCSPGSCSRKDETFNTVA